MESSRCLKLLKSAATDSGVKYELKISALLFIRAQKKGLNFEMFRNVETALPFDDVVIRVLNGNDSRLFFVQLKHGEEKGKTVSLQSFCPRERDGPKIETGDFNLRKYYTLSEKLYRIHNRQGKPPTKDEEILMETPLDKVWFIIYTNKIIQQAPKDTDQSEDTKMMNDLFETSSSGSSIRFNESQKNIWNQMDKDESKKRIYKEIFLPHLKIFHGQIHVDDLDAQILLEIKSIIGSPLPKESQNNILENFLEKIEKWTKETSGISLCHYDRILEQAVTQELRRRIQEALTLLEFKDEHLEETEKLLQELDQKAKKEKNLVRSQMCIRQILPGLRASKILQVMKKNDCYRNSWIYVDDWLLENYSFEAITLSLRVIDFLIIDLSQEKIYEQQTLLKTAKEFPICVVELTNEDKAELAEDWTLEHLTTEYQYKLLQRPINFQGQEIKLGHLEETWPSLRNHVSGIELNDLVSGKLIEVGTALPDLDYLYIERKLQHTRSRRVNSSIWNIRSDKDRFILKNFSEEILQDLRKSDSPWEECDIFWKPLSENKSSKSTSSDKSEESVKSQLTRTKWTVEEGKQQVNLRSKENVHWLTMKEGEIVWEKSHRKFNIIKEHSKNNKRCLSLKAGNCVHDDAKDFLKWTDKCIILADTPGKGKSTFITHIAREIKLQHKSNWMIVIRLNDGYILEKLPKQVDMIGNAEVLDIFFNTVFFPGREESLNWKHFLADAFQETGFINVFIDGVDEVCPAYKSRALRLLETIKRTMEKSGGKIWVATRPVLEDDLKHVLNCRTPLSLLPYSRNDQIKYILWRWKDTLMDVSQVERERRVAYFVDTVRAATSTVRGATSSKETFSLSDLPLYTKMLAEVYLGSEFYTDENLPKNLSRLNLYISFVEKTIEGMWEKDGLTEGKRENLNISCDEILAKHKNYAAVVCFDEDGKILPEFPFLEHAMQQITTSNQIEKQARPGLISSIVNGKPSFVHFTILEFLGSWWLFDEWCRDSNKVHLITEKLYTEKYSVCRYFFDAFLAKGKTIHEMLLGGRLAELHLQFTYHQEPNDDKRTYEHIQNKRTVIANEKDAGGRRPLHLAVIMEDLSAVKILVQAGADLNAEDEVLKWTPLRYADHMFRKGPGGRKLLEVIDLLLGRGANSSHINNNNKTCVVYTSTLFFRIVNFRQLS